MNRHCVYVRRLFYAAPFIGCCITFVTFIPRLRSALCECECVFARAHFFNIASTFMREFNVLLNDIYSNLLHWKYQFSWLRLINDYVWLCICLIICLFVCMCECACAFMIANANVHVYTLLCSIFSIVHSVHTYLPQLVILISDVWRNLSLPLAVFFSSPTIHRIENKSKGIQLRINCMRCEINECTKVARSSSVSTLSV